MSTRIHYHTNHTSSRTRQFAHQSERDVVRQFGNTVMLPLYHASLLLLMCHVRTMSNTPCESSTSLQAEPIGQSTCRPDEPSQGVKHMAARPSRSGLMMGSNHAALNAPAQRPVQSLIPSKKEAQCAANVTLQYFQNNLDGISSSELNDLYQIKQRFQGPN